MTFLANPHFIWQISHAKTFKWSIQGAHTIISSKNIHKVAKTDYMWFEFSWIRRCLPQHRLQTFRRLWKVSFKSLTFIPGYYCQRMISNGNYWNWYDITIVLSCYDYVSIIVYFSLKFVPKPVDKHWKSILLI